MNEYRGDRPIRVIDPGVTGEDLPLLRPRRGRPRGSRIAEQSKRGGSKKAALEQERISARKDARRKGLDKSGPR